MQIRDLPYADPGVPDVRSGTRFLLWLGRNQLGGQVKALLWGLLLQLGIAALPLGVGVAVQAVVDHDGGRLALAGGLLVAFGLAIAAGDTMMHRTAVTNWITAAARVQQLLSRKTAELGSVLTRRVAAGEVVAVSTGDVEKIGWFVEALSRFAAAAVSLLIVCVALVLYQPALGIVVALGVPVLALAVLPLLPRATRRADVQREKAGKATELASDTVAGLRVLRGIGGEELFLDRYRAASQEVRRAAVHSARMWALIAAIQVVLPGVLLIVVVAYGARLALDGRITVGELVTVYGAVALTHHPMRNFEEIAMAFSFSRPSAKRAARVLSLNRTTSTTDAVEGEERKATGDLYDPLTGLLAPAGRFTAVVCGDPDMAGRLADRLGGHPAEQDLVEQAHTSVLLGGVPLDELPLEAARTAVLVQDKDPVLLSGTLRELLDVPSSGAVRAADALEAAQCGDVLDALAQASVDADGDPMRTRITERGRSLSGGQRQRLALARSLVTDPEVLVLDEPTSAVDSHTESRVADGIARLRAGGTTVVLASSPLLLDRADRVVLIHEGQAVAVGTHRELLAGEPRYRAVVTRETDEELAAASDPLRELEALEGESA
ncbi:ABC transporter ATP-binding protein [Streptomyces sp. NBC_00094]|uniref:ABC transporter transmembrane domain-containing protein n=1 Tax=Streptomyces sp. NBC_00094 TaxID=2903620 RepID=UPI00224D9A1D|nr:ABC transporter ATP-binding protein [Streptomyces sp. NBC_00094]MCX5389263.1 ABC transporter ATP-binding protein/permease [Streptomyces sp. NBC_00094]